jgi:hypothetical protein
MRLLQAIAKSSTMRRDRTPLARVMAGALLIGIIYTSTLGFVHSHGIVPSNLGTDTSAGFTGQAGPLVGDPIRGRSNENECLICVLHRQFSSSTVHTPLFIVGPSIEIAFVSAPATFYYTSATTSRPIARMSGRDPPNQA